MTKKPKRLTRAMIGILLLKIAESGVKFEELRASPEQTSFISSENAEGMARPIHGQFIREIVQKRNDAENNDQDQDLEMFKLMLITRSLTSGPIFSLVVSISGLIKGLIFSQIPKCELSCCQKVHRNKRSSYKVILSDLKRDNQSTLQYINPCIYGLLAARVTMF